MLTVILEDFHQDGVLQFYNTSKPEKKLPVTVSSLLQSADTSEEDVWPETLNCHR